MTPEQLVQNGIALTKAGQPAEAAALFSRALQVQPDREDAWFWLGLCLAEPERRRYCFQRVLTLNPAHAEARDQLGRLNQPEPPSQLPDPLTSSPLAEPASDPAPPPEAGSAEGAEAVDQPARPAAPVAASHFSTVHSRWIAAGVALAGLLLGLVVCGGPLATLAAFGAFDTWFGIAAQPVSATPAEVTPFASPPLITAGSPTPTPDPTTRATPLPPQGQLPPGLEDELGQARALMLGDRWAEAIPFWDQIIDQAPDLAEAYFERGRAYYGLTSNQRSKQEYLDYLEQARTDLDQAIVLMPTMGEYYLYRYYVYDRLGNNQTYRADYDVVKAIALENLRMANRLGNSDELAERLVVFRLYELGRCDEGLAETERLLAIAPTPSAGLNTALAQGYLCRGQLDRALDSIDTALQIYPSAERHFTRAIILFNAGQLTEALRVLDQAITDQPYYWASRYFLRSVIYGDLGQWDRAEADLVTGAGQTWDDWSIVAYARARMALHAGDRSQAITWLQYAEATLTRDYGPLLDRVRVELQAEGAAPLVLTPSLPFTATPLPELWP